MSAVPSSNQEARSLADEVRGVRKRVATRLAELAPLVQEYEELLALAAELGIPAGLPDPASNPGPSTSGARAAGETPEAGAVGGPPRRGRGSDAERRQQIIDAVEANPGATVVEVAAILGSEAKALYRPVRDLANSGALIKRGRQLFPASG